MVVTKPAEIRQEQKKFFNIAYQGEPVVVSRPRSENVVIISENEYRRMSSSNHLLAYYYKLNEAGLLDREKDSQFFESTEQALEYSDFPFKPISKKEFIERIDRSLKEIREGKVRDAFEALDDICEEIESEAI